MAERRQLLRQDPFGSKGHGTAAAAGFGLGALSMAGVALALCGPAAGGPFGAYVALLALFHQLEYICVAAYRADTLSFDCASTRRHPPPAATFRAPPLNSVVGCLAAFVINHSTAYTIAAVTSWVEYAVELWLFPSWTGWCVQPADPRIALQRGLSHVSYPFGLADDGRRGPVSAAGLLVMLVGHGVRIAAFITAGSNFSHIVETGAVLPELVYVAM